MNAALLKRHITFRLKQLGRPGALGAVLLLAVAVYAIVVVIEFDSVEQRIRAGEEKLRAAAAGRSGPLTPAEQLAAFYQAFPGGATVPDVLGKIYGVAGAQNLSLDIGDYSLARAQSGRLDQFRITFPVKGSYPQIRKFVGAALATAPALALESIQFKRDKVGDAVVEARVEFLLYVEKGA